MLKTGLYKWVSAECGLFGGESCLLGGHVKVWMKETKHSFIITLVESTCKFEAPQLDDLFRDSPRVVIRKSGSKHALNISGDDWFCLYPYCVGVPYPFRMEE